jgi:FKBP-type peptidyl-prolyl cis-trans isomerase FkpA
MAEKADKQTKIDHKLIEAHLTAKGIHIVLHKDKQKEQADSTIAYKHESGLYYIIHHLGDGKPGLDNSNVSVNYTGYLLDGLVFDSNTDPKYKHVEPIRFTVGKGQMIKGWDKILPLMNVGHKITVFIPSPLAYGPQARPPHIPANGILVFDMELLAVE